MTQRHVLLLDLIDEPASIARYEAWHAAGAVPKAVVASIRTAGIAAMQIFRSGNRLVMVMDVTAAFDPAAKARADAADPDVVAWEALMDGFQQRLPWATAGEKWVEAPLIFDLAAQE
ncbi:L-rhamnose mutarotase [Sphingomonas sp. BK580]|uniref:L-rhamnose mutarotase n=1 Tax=Sphingomonas sp. BK580 TaxID=2586972 RepID=UPI00160F63AE|nr:L-rhamnose mutarotase [Sphingomonas sp. BK580]MBB3693298.1 L-rhamnose mutarotase [Sphingomonas sp. BK580]